jgi:phosphotransferase system enzyme I (PtsI)
MVGIVVVSHSPRLAQAAVDLALEMVPDAAPRVAIAAGTGDGQTGTDAVRVSEAIARVGSPQGVLVFMDLGSAVLSAEMALDFVTDPAVPVRLTSAPFVEGLLAAVVRASGGASLDEVEREARGALFAKQSQLGESDGAPALTGASVIDGEQSTVELELVNRDGMHARPAATLVSALTGLDAIVTVQRVGGSAKAVELSGPTALLAIGGRQGDRLRFGASGPDAAAVLSRITELVEAGFGESLEPAPDLPTSPVARHSAGPIGVSPGRAVGAVVLMPAPLEEPPAIQALAAGARTDESSRIAPAAADVAAELLRRADSAPSATRDILAATAALATDAGVLDQARQSVLHDGATAERAVWDAFGRHAAALTAHGGRAAERAADLGDVRDRLVARLRGLPAPGVPQRSEPYVLVARDLAPADTAVLDPALCRAIVTEEGGPTSHTAILARSLGIPAVVAAHDAWSHPAGAVLLVDGSTGELVWDPDAATIEAVASAPPTPSFSGSGATADGRPVPLLANVGTAEGAREAAAAGAEGVGLFRTEFLFLDREQAPSIDEQVAAYRAVFAAFPGRKVIARTLDAGADKPLPFVTSAHEPNPALGIRGYRTSWRRPEVLADQLTALARAADQERAQVSVMAPMISTVDEAADFVAQCRTHGIESAGVMIETPAAALSALQLLEVVDFVSLGTNDLAQYTMAADRLVGDLAALNDPWQPAVLRLIELVGQAGLSTGRPVGVCGEAAADPLLAVVLVGAGVTSLSMTARALDAVGDRLGRVTIGQAREAATVAIGSRTPAEARAAATAVLG